jgi:hypothetical protein
MDKRLLFVDPLTGLKTFHSYDSLTDETIISYEADSSPIIEVNKQIANDNDAWKEGMKQDFVLYASIPVEVQLDWLINKGVDVYKQDDSKKVFQLLNDPEYLYLKTTHKHHQAK